MLTREEILKTIICQHYDRLIGTISEIDSYNSSEDAKSLSIHVTFREPFISTTGYEYTLELNDARDN